MLGAGHGGAPKPDSLMLSTSSESTTERLCSSPAMARSKAFCFTILLHSWYFILASLSWGFTFTTWAGRWAEGRKGGRRGHQPWTKQGCRAVRRWGCHSCPRAAQSWAQGVLKPGRLGPHWWRNPGQVHLRAAVSVSPNQT